MWLGNVEVENLKHGVEEGIKKATKEIPIRPNIVDPLSRKNTNNNVGDYIPPIDIELIDEDYLEITILPKGFGSENNNAMKMALPAEGIEGIKQFVVESVPSFNIFGIIFFPKSLSELGFFSSSSKYFFNKSQQRDRKSVV